MTTRATTAMTAISDQPMSNMLLSAPLRAVALCPAGLGDVIFLRGRVVDHLAGGVGLDLVLVFLDALFEGFDALGRVAHDLLDLPPTAERKQDDGQSDQPMPNAQATHDGGPP